MPLSKVELQALSRLLDEALELPPEDRDAWLAALPAVEQSFVPLLRRALAPAAGASSAPALRLPTLPGSLGDAQPGEQFGPYRLIEEIGRGGMGSVWRAERSDGLFQREVALKLPRIPWGTGLAKRMAREREIGARLEHPHIARLYDAGIDAHGRPFLVMERVHGSHLGRHADDRRLPTRQRIELLIQVCDAVAHAHRHLVVHRDLKPSNIMVDETGAVKLLDFGVARLLEDDGGAPSATLSDTHLTRTPQYAAPEQVTGGPVTTATDVYALGVVSYELLTGTYPHGPAPGPAWLAEPIPPSRAAVPAEQAALRGGAAALRRELTPELDAVLLRALQREPQARYASIERLADDLRALLAHRLPLAAPSSARRRCRLFAQRHRGGIAWSVAALAGLVLAAALLLAERARTQAQEGRLAQVRLFMLTTFTDAEPLDGQPIDRVTGVQMVESALARARNSFASEPTLRAEVYCEIAITLRRFGRPQEAMALLREAHALMQGHAGDDDPGRHIVAAQLALESLAEAAHGGNDTALAQAKPLAESVVNGCTADTARCAKARAHAQAALRNLATLQGDTAVALAFARQATAETDRAFGHPHAEGAAARVQMALVLRNAGLLQEADAALAEAAAVAGSTPLRIGDADELRLVQAMLQGDLGRHAKALDGLRALLRDARPDAPDAALLHRLSAQSEFALGLLPEALRSAAAVLDVAGPQGDTWEAVNAHAVRTRALAVAGQSVAARQALQEWRAAVTALGGAPTDMQSIRLRRGEAEIALREGRLEEARAAVQGLTEGPHATPAVSPLEQASNWELQAALARHQGRWDEALAAHARAAELLSSRLPESHPLRLRNRLEKALVDTLRSGQAADEPLRQAVQGYLDVLPAESAWWPMVQGLLARPAAGLAIVL